MNTMITFLTEEKVNIQLIVDDKIPKTYFSCSLVVWEI